jgi:tetratricopeptide (TPR) repeat protein
MKLLDAPVLHLLLLVPLGCASLLSAPISSVSVQQVSGEKNNTSLPTDVHYSSENSTPSIDATDQDSLKKNLGTECLALAQAYEKEGTITKALQFYKKAVEYLPDDAQTNFAYANLLYGQNKISEAIEYYKKTLAIKNDIPAAHHNAGVCLEKNKEYDAAFKHFQEATRLQPEYTSAYLHSGNILKDQKKHTEALTCFEQGLRATPHSLDLLQAAAGVLKELNRFDEAIAYYRTACEQNPQNLTCLLELGNTYNMLNLWPEALECYKKILEIRPNTHEVLYNFGYTLKKMGRVQEAITVYDKVLEINPTYPHARFSRSLAYLSLGDFTRGWPEYEWRWQAYNESPKKYPQPVWDGSNPAGKTILVYAEQGLGDTFQFIRYAKCIKDQGGKVIAIVQKPLKKILSLCPYLDTVLTPHDPKPDFDAHIALMSLPLVYKTEITTIPTDIPYLYAKPELVEQWRTKLAADKNFKIGLCWQGNPFYSSQFLRQAVAGKSMHVKTLLPFGAIKGITLYSLQKMSGADQLDTLGDKLVIHTIDGLDEENGPFMDTAAIMKNLDLMITIDTSIAHIAGGLGIPVWCLLPEPADWRWLLKRSDTPWFPKNMRLFRQPKPGDWNSVINEVARELEKLLAQKPQKNTPTNGVNANTQSSVPMPHPTNPETPIKTTAAIIAPCVSIALAQKAEQQALSGSCQKRLALEPFIPTPFDVHADPAKIECSRTPTSARNQTEQRTGQILPTPKTEVAAPGKELFQYCDPIAEFVDTLTMLAIKAEDGSLSAQEKTHYEILLKRYATYEKNMPDLELLKEQLQTANKQSLILSKKSTSLQELKKYLKKKISELDKPQSPA